MLPISSDLAIDDEISDFPHPAHLRFPPEAAAVTDEEPSTTQLPSPTVADMDVHDEASSDLALDVINTPQHDEEEEVFFRTENDDVGKDSHDRAAAGLALYVINAPHQEEEEDEEDEEESRDEEKDDAGIDSRDETPSNLASAVLNTTQHVQDQKEEENDEKTDTVARSDTETSMASKNKTHEGDKEVDSQVVDDFISEEEARKKDEASVLDEIAFAEFQSALEG